MYSTKKKKAKLLTVVPFTELSFNFKKLDDMVKLREAVQTHYNQSQIGWLKDRNWQLEAQIKNLEQQLHDKEQSQVRQYN